MATFQSSAMSKSPKATHVGINTVAGSVSTGATSGHSAGDIYQLCKIPSGATITSVQFDHTSGSATCVIDYGLNHASNTAQTSASCFATNVATGTVTRQVKPGILPLAVSSTDAAADNLRYAIVQGIAISGTKTTSVQVNFVVQYTVDP